MMMMTTRSSISVKPDSSRERRACSALMRVSPLCGLNDVQLRLAVQRSAESTEDSTPKWELKGVEKGRGLPRPFFSSPTRADLAAGRQRRGVRDRRAGPVLVPDLVRDGCLD